MPSLAVDLGGTHLRCAVALDGRTLVNVERVRVAGFIDGVSSQAIWESVFSHVASYAAAVPLLGPGDPIVFAFPGPVVDGRIVAAPTVAGADSDIPDVAFELARRTGRRVWLINDVSAAAWHLSASLDADRFMVLTVSSGIGSKIFDRRHPARVLDDVVHAGEIGHCTVDDSPDAPVCDCGARGHLGAIASGRGVERLARRAALENPLGFAASRCVRSFGATADSVDNERHIVPAIRDGDEWATDVLSRATEPLARTVASVAYAVGLSRVVVIGGFALAVGPAYVRILARYLPFQPDGAISLRPQADEFVTLASGDPEACLRGAAAYAERLVTSSV